MLVVMTFNAGLCLVILAGFCSSRLLFYPEVLNLIVGNVTLSKGLVEFEDGDDDDHCHVRS